MRKKDYVILPSAPLSVLAQANQTTIPLEWIAVSPDGKGFVRTPSGRAFVPWGFNYDHDEGGRLIEEMFPLSCSAGELEDFIRRSRPTASGWIGFYWGQTAESLRQEKTIPAALTLGWFEVFGKLRPVMAP